MVKKTQHAAPALYSLWRRHCTTTGCCAATGRSRRKKRTIREGTGAVITGMRTDIRIEHARKALSALAVEFEVR